MKTILCKSLAETEAFAKEFVDSIKPPVVITLTGDLGAGKTAFTKFLCKALDIKSIVTSPTFTLMNEYDEGKYKLYHFDMYRIENADEIYELGFDEYFCDKDAIVVVEWPEVVKDLLPNYGYDIIIEKIDETQRKFTIKERK